MPYKIGGGNKLQWYNIKNGEYDELGSDIELINSNSINNLNKYINDEILQNDLYFPDYRFHNIEYCKLFVDAIKNKLYKDQDSIELSKCKYLLTYNHNRDKSKFLNDMGFYSDGTLYLALNDSVDFKNTKFDKINEYGFFVSVETDLISNDKNYTKKVDTIWQIDNNLRARFITMIIGGKKYGNK